jgi:PAS domain S-box-containing protein
MMLRSEEPRMPDGASTGPGRPRSPQLESAQLIGAVRVREKFLEDILGSLESFVTVDRDWRFTFVNEAAAKLAGRRPDDLMGENLLELTPLSAMPQASGPLREAMSERVSVEFEVDSPAREEVFHAKAYPLSDGGLAIYVRNVTDSRRIEQAMRESEAKQAAQRERTHLAGELHDSVTQALFAATMKAEALALDDSLPARSADTLEEVRRLTRGALAQMRTLLLELRADPLETVPIQQLLRHLAEATESRVRTVVRLTMSEESPLPGALHAPVYRIVQEALDNVARHALAPHAWVDLDVRPTGFHLVVGDDGRGFDLDAVDPGHHGLRSMREHAGEVGARLQLQSSIGGGTQLTVDWRAAPAPVPD